MKRVWTTQATDSSNVAAQSGRTYRIRFIVLFCESRDSRMRSSDGVGGHEFGTAVPSMVRSPGDAPHTRRCPHRRPLLQTRSIPPSALPLPSVISYSPEAPRRASGFLLPQCVALNRRPPRSLRLHLQHNALQCKPKSSPPWTSDCGCRQEWIPAKMHLPAGDLLPTPEALRQPPKPVFLRPTRFMLRRRRRLGGDRVARFWTADLDRPESASVPFRPNA